MSDVNIHVWHRSPGLFTDLYELTMAQGYFAAGVTDTLACFHLFFRRNPFEGGYALVCGLEQALDYLQALSFPAADIEYLSTLMGNDGRPIFTSAFLRHLETFRFNGDVAAVPEGTVVFPHEPLLRVTGPIIPCQIVETALLNIINFQTLIATKAARICEAADGDPVVEFGLRRAQGPDGGISAARAAFVGGCQATSNVLAGRTYGIPVAGTHAHSWVLMFENETDAFRAYADALPNNVTFLVDTYDTLAGVRRAAEEGRRLREHGFEMVGVRIDSGDLAWLSREARAILDAAGLQSARIVASNELDEHLITSLREQKAAIDIWGVGTRLVAAHDQPALGGVYKLSAVRQPGGDWKPRIKVSEQALKTTIPGVQGIRRFLDGEGRPAGDMVYDIAEAPGDERRMIDPADPNRRKRFSRSQHFEELLVPAMRAGMRECAPVSLPAIQARSRRQLESIDRSVRRFLNPHQYPVGLDENLYSLRARLIEQARQREA